MKVFLTGGNGFIGRAILAELQSAGHELLVLSRRGGEGRQTPTHGCIQLHGDLTQLAAIAPAIEKFQPEEMTVMGKIVVKIAIATLRVEY